LILATMQKSGRERWAAETTSHTTVESHSKNAMTCVTVITDVGCSFSTETTAGSFHLLVLRQNRDGRMCITEVKILVTHANGITNVPCNKLLTGFLMEAMIALEPEPSSSSAKHLTTSKSADGSKELHEILTGCAMQTDILI
jgi:hypothetical protein